MKIKVTAEYIRDSEDYRHTSVEEWHGKEQDYLREVLELPSLRITRIDDVHADGVQGMLDKGRDEVNEEVLDVLNEKFWDRAVQRYADEHNVDADWLHKFLESE